jgi:trk system potassium uptake protein TrkH
MIMIGYLRKKDFYLIFKNLGIVMHGIGVVMLIPLLVALIYGETDYGGYLISGILSISIGFLFRQFFPEKASMRLKHGMILAAIAWLWAALMGSICLMYTTDVVFLNAYFESMSAWTGSGLSIYTNVQILPTISSVFKKPYAMGWWVRCSYSGYWSTYPSRYNSITALQSRSHVKKR